MSHWFPRSRDLGGCVDTLLGLGLLVRAQGHAMEFGAPYWLASGSCPGTGEFHLTATPSKE